MCARARTGGGVGVRGARVLVDKLGGVRVVERAGGAPRRDGALLLQLVGEGDGAAHLRPRDREPPSRRRRTTQPSDTAQRPARHPVAFDGSPRSTALTKCVDADAQSRRNE